MLHRARSHLLSRSLAAASNNVAVITRVRHASSAAVVTKLGSPLELQTIEPPSLGPKQVRIKVAAAGVNFADILQARGEYQDTKDPPYVPGNECAGEVVEVADDLAGQGWAVGDRVISLTRGGAYASEAVADARACIKLPASAASADLQEAAALMVNYGTAHLALAHRARLQEGETVLVTAAAGGVGLAATELSKLLGAKRVIAACGSEAKIRTAALKGAEAEGVNYTGMDGKTFRARLKEVAGKQGIDVVVDMIGAEYLEPCVRALNFNGRGVVIGFAGGGIPKIPANVLLVKNLSLSGLFWGAHLIHDPKTLVTSAQQLVKWWLAGDIKPHVGAALPLGEANEAFALIEGRKSEGKVVLVP